MRARRALLALAVVATVVIDDAMGVPPAGCIGDYNDDGSCADAADYVAYRKHEGTEIPLPNRANPGTTIGPDDYNNWRENFAEGFVASAAGPEAVAAPMLACDHNEDGVC